MGMGNLLKPGQDRLVELHPVGWPILCKVVPFLGKTVLHIPSSAGPIRNHTELIPLRLSLRSTADRASASKAPVPIDRSRRDMECLDLFESKARQRSGELPLAHAGSPSASRSRASSNAETASGVASSSSWMFSKSRRWRPPPRRRLCSSSFLNQDAPHGLGRCGKEVSPTIPAAALVIIDHRIYASCTTAVGRACCRVIHRLTCEQPTHAAPYRPTAAAAPRRLVRPVQSRSER